VWLTGAVVCLLAANHGSNCSLMQAMDGCIVCCSIISSCQLVATSETVKVLLISKSSYVRSTIASTGLCRFIVVDDVKKIENYFVCSAFFFRFFSITPRFVCCISLCNEINM